MVPSTNGTLHIFSDLRKRALHVYSQKRRILHIIQKNQSIVTKNVQKLSIVLSFSV